ncbi:hypothetical protein [Legionella maioricensis]|uniref:Uncharacterized protein n=1 Tax=Legionella maioricensis TaxID=2896528 RepID=A0A9X2D390_9GAMM|nr:hypothetical protein [Legionella maioricensis]MCL9685648.1 hypothetical protein [Legionella maioricensis]MCL9689057.1 hypothetical protein [Legionella maioricensis]
MPINPPSPTEIDKNKKRYKPCDANMEIMLADLDDLTEDIYVGLCRVIKKPDDISLERFKKILYVKAKIFNYFVSGKLLIDTIFDDLEKECATNFLCTSIMKEELLKMNLCPKYYKSSVMVHKASEDDEIEEVYYFPIIAKEILAVDYPIEILTQVLTQQLQKHDVNIAISQRTATTFLKTNGWFAFFGIVPVDTAVSLLKRGMIFIDPPDYPDTDSRLHGPLSHAIQEYLTSKLLEGGHLGSLQVKGERDITERDLVKADAWLLKKGGMEGVYCLFDIMRERRPNKFKLLDVYPDEVYGFTSPDFLNQYLILNPFRFPILSTLLYNQYALGTLSYFKLAPDFAQLGQEEQLNIMNTHSSHLTFTNDLSTFTTRNPGAYIPYGSKSDNQGVMLKAPPKPLFKFAHTFDDSESYLRARKKTEASEVESSSKFQADK